MKEKFDKYWSGMHRILVVATILDPRYKMKLVEYHFPLIFGDEAQVEVEKVKAFCHKLLKEYKRPRHSTENTSHSSLSSQAESSTTVGKHSRIAGFDKFVSNSVTADHERTSMRGLRMAEKGGFVTWMVMEVIASTHMKRKQ
ncbi:unnamed protein product [Fraxinus pennsylvanica]|uniref:hAT-like transposase RNase-H fold domain-containing protein n=1 Tax=Fraxinus pennsylvanica TaxID=56036 RepID=A0AAD1Z2T7_9LAMI|nr:unnamed protein product [Fraxinus pennsylvanica]